MRVDSIYRAGYAVVVEANGGEEQLTFVYTGGQNGRTKAVAVATQVDGGQKVVFHEEVASAALTDHLVAVFRHWTQPGHPRAPMSDPDADAGHLAAVLADDTGARRYDRSAGAPPLAG